MEEWAVLLEEKKNWNKKPSFLFFPFFLFVFCVSIKCHSHDRVLRAIRGCRFHILTNEDIWLTVTTGNTLFEMANGNRLSHMPWPLEMLHSARLPGIHNASFAMTSGLRHLTWQIQILHMKKKMGMLLLAWSIGLFQFHGNQKYCCLKIWLLSWRLMSFFFSFFFSSTFPSEKEKKTRTYNLVLCVVVYSATLKPVITSFFHSFF